jgi:hypothetical protein
MDADGSGPKQVAVKSSPEGDPALFRVRPAGRLPVTVFTGAQTERPSNYYLSHLFRKHKTSQEIFYQKNWQAGTGLGGPAGKGLFPLSLSAIFLAFFLKATGL